MGSSTGAINVCSRHNLPILPFGRSEAEAAEFIKPADAEKLQHLEDASALLQMYIIAKQLYELQPDIPGEEGDNNSPFSIVKGLSQSKGKALHELSKEIRRTAAPKDLFLEVLGAYSTIYADLENALNANKATKADERTAALQQIGTVKSQYSILMAKLASSYNRLSPETKEFFLKRAHFYYLQPALVNQPLTERLTTITNETLDDLLPNKLNLDAKDSEYTAFPAQYLERLEGRITETCAGLQQQLATAPFRAKKKDADQKASPYAWKVRLGSTAGTSSGDQSAIPNYPASAGIITPRAGISFQASELDRANKFLLGLDQIFIAYDYAVPFQTDGDPYSASDDASLSLRWDFSGESMLSLDGRYFYEDTDLPNTYYPSHRTGTAAVNYNYPFTNIFSLTGGLNYSGGSIDLGSGAHAIHEVGATFDPTFMFEEYNLKLIFFGLSARTALSEELTHLQALISLQHRSFEGGIPFTVINSGEGNLISVPFYLKANLRLGNSLILSPFVQGYFASNDLSNSVDEATGLAGNLGVQLEWRSQ